MRTAVAEHEGEMEVENDMQMKSLTALVRHHLDHARGASSGRSAETVYGGHEHVLRQTLIALRAGQRLEEHYNLVVTTWFWGKLKTVVKVSITKQSRQTMA